ncbi:MAG: NADH:ubiquinone oxidoreductase [Pseudomonadota bacterium]
MSQTGSNNVSLTFCAVIGLFLGALVTALLMVVGDWNFLPAAAVGILFLILAILLLPLWFIRGNGSDVPFGAPVTGNEAGTAPTAASAAPVAPAPTAPAAAPAPAPAAATQPLVSEVPEAKPEPAPEPAPAPKPKAEKKPDPAPSAAADESEPEILTAARDGKADDLKQIKGVGPGLEKTLNELGFYHFDQIAKWGDGEIAWVDARLKFKGRIVRDSWVDQCKTLAAGGATEFSNKVKKGDVY